MMVPTSFLSKPADWLKQARPSGIIRDSSWPSLVDADIAASPEWFGDGWNSFRQVLVRRELAELLAQASPRDFYLAEVTMASPR
jgi:hypothetical protein